MKIKEKLAWDYLDPYFINESEGYNLNEHEIFLSGFEKAREMAAERIKASVAPGIPEFINQYLQAKHDHDICLKLGEEEV